MKLLLLVFGLLQLNFHTAVAQESYTIKMTMKIEGLPPEWAGFGEQEIINYSKGEMYKKEVNGMMGSSIVCFDGKTLTQLNEGMDKKTGFTASKEELEAMGDKEPKESPKIEYTSETKKIAGYDCTKAIITSSSEGKESKVIVWVTEKIKINPKVNKTKGKGMKMDFGDLKGQPLQIEATQNSNGNDMKVIITATEVSTTPLEDSFFTVNTEGYTMMSYQEMLESMKRAPKNGGGE